MLLETPQDPFLNYAYAMELTKEGVVSEACSAFSRVRELDPNYVPAYFQEGQLLARDGQIEAAREILQNGLAVAQQVGDSHAFGEMTEFLNSL